MIEHNLVGQPEIRKANFGGDHTPYFMARLEHIQLVFDERNITESPIEDLIPLKVLVKGYQMEHRLPANNLHTQDRLELAKTVACY